MEEKKPKGKGRKAVFAALIGVGVVLVAVSVFLLLTKDKLPSAVNAEGTERVSLVVQITETPAPVNVNIETTEAPASDTPVPAPTYTPNPTAEPTPTPTIHPYHGDVLKAGMHAPIVMDIQLRLMDLEYLSFEQPDDEYSDGTEIAITAFQRRNGLNVTGDCDSETFRALVSDEAKSYAVVEGDMGDEVLMIEERLVELGYQTSEVDGIYDPDTSDAVERFREKNSLGNSREIDSEAYEVLLGEDPVANYYSVGEVDENIRVYQTKLYGLGYLTFAPDGKFGALTAAAVKRFQENNGLVVDGCLGKTTIALLMTDGLAAFNFTNGMSGEDVARIQQRLVYYGYMGSATGYYGDVTEAAVKSFQKRNGLTQDGAVGADTMAKLNSDNAKRAAATPKPTSQTTPKPSNGSTTTSKPTSGTATAAPTNSGSTINYGQGIEAFIAIAKSKLGCKYVRGAKGPNTFDCSGFVYWCLNQAGVNQSYLTSIGWRSCTKYRRINSMSEMKRGDVIVFSGDGSGKGHVAIYLGNDQMIDASSSKGKVVIRDTIQTNYWKSHFLMAYRIWD